MWTKNYKGCYVHGYIDKPECLVVFYHGNRKNLVCKSYRAAQIAITKYNKEQGIK